MRPDSTWTLGNFFRKLENINLEKIVKAVE